MVVAVPVAPPAQTMNAVNNYYIGDKYYDTTVAFSIGSKLLRNKSWHRSSKRARVMEVSAPL